MARRHAIAQLAAVQGGHISTRQLRQLDVSPSAIRHMVASGYLIPVYHGVFAVGHESRRPLDIAHAALLAVGGSAAMAYFSAAAIWGVRDDWPVTPQLVTTLHQRTRAAHRPGRPDHGLEVIRNTALTPADVTVHLGLTVVSPALMLLQIAPDLPAKQLTRAIDELRLARRLRHEQLADVHSRFRHHRGAAALGRALAELQPEPTRSTWEQAWPRFASRYNLPPHSMNVRVGPYRVDVLFTPARLIVELDGWTTHGAYHAFRRDRNQDAEILAALGIPTIRIVKRDFDSNPTGQAARIVQILAGRP